MEGETKNIAIIGANKDGLALLPVIIKDKRSRVVMIADPNRDAMLFKLSELGYHLADNLAIQTTTNLDDIKKIKSLDIIINALQDEAVEAFLEAPEFKNVEKLGALSTRLLWSVRGATQGEAITADRASDQVVLLGSLREIVDAVRLTVDRKELLSVILKLATESTRAERGSIMLISSEEGFLRVEIAKGMDEEVVRKIRVQIGEGISGRVALEGKPILISGRAKDEEFTRVMDRSDVKSAMCVPLVVSGEVIGVLNVSSNESTHVFTNEDLTFLVSLAGLAAEVIFRSNEFERLRVDAAKFTFWKEASAIMSSAAPLGARLTLIAKKLAELIPGLACFIYIFDEDRDRLFLRAASIRDAKSLGLMSLRAAEGMEGWSIESAKDLFLVDRTADANVKRMYISLPMVSQGALVGTLNCQIVSAQQISKYHELFLKEIRDLISESVYEFKQLEKEKLKTRRMIAVDEAGLEIISIKEPKRLVTVLSATPAAIMGAEGSLLRLRQSSGQFHSVASFGLDDKTVRDYFLPFEKETVLEVLRKDDYVMREFSEDVSPYIRSVFAYPLKVGDRTTGVITFFNKTSEESFYPFAFAKSDVDTMKRFSVYSEKALAIALESGAILTTAPGSGPPPVLVFERKTAIEIDRAKRTGHKIIMATVAFNWLKESFAGNLSEFEDRFVGAVKRRTRSFDVGARLDRETFAFLFLETEAENVPRLMDAITEAIINDKSFSEAFRAGKVEVNTGSAIYPADGRSFAELFAKACTRTRFEIHESGSNDAHMDAEPAGATQKTVK